MGLHRSASGSSWTEQHARILRGIALAAALLLVVAACAGDDAAPASSADASPSPFAATLAPTQAPLERARASEQLCALVDDLVANTESMRAIELKLVNRVALDIEVSKVEASFDELEGADLGDLEVQLETPLTRLGYRFGELELAVEDFRTNSRIRRAVPHVEKDAETFANELAAFSLLARC
jgi:hypothetical protein